MTQPVCLVTGAGPGNGQALARRFAAGGYRIALLARDEQRLEALAAEIDGAAAYPCDLAAGDRIESVLAAVAADLGPVDTLLYNAGAAVFGDIDRITPEDFESAWRTNAFGLYHCARAVLSGMRQAGGGNIVVTGATASKKGGAGFAAAKAAQYSLAQSLARHLGPEGIHVAIAIIDGVIDSARPRDTRADKAEADCLRPAAIAESIYQITQQPRSAWTFELDLRPHGEKW